VSDAPQTREVARRVFAAEFDDATLSYSEGDEERAPNYVVTPTGARINRLFAVGALTEVEAVNDEIVRGRVADPTGVFVSYAGQYQPDAMAFLERATPPSFVSLTGKARTYQPDDSDRIFTSVRPESLNEVDADTRDRWVVAAAEATLDRVATTAAALKIDARGDDLRATLESRGVEGALAQGVALALDHYEPTEHYLEAVRTMAVQGLELVAGDREAVDSLDVAPDETGPDTLGPLPAVAAASATADEDVASAVGGTASSVGGASADESTDATATEVTDDAAATGSDTGADVTDAESPGSVDDASDGESASGASDTAETAEAPESTASDPGADAEQTESEPAADEPTASEAAGVGDDPVNAAAPADDPDSGSDGLGDFGVEDEAVVADEPTGDEGPAVGGGTTSGDEPAGGNESTADEPAADEASAAADPDLDEGEMYELDPEERAEIEAEYGTEFSTGNEVSEPGEADIDVPDVEELESAAAGAVPSEDSTADDSGVDSTPDTGTDPAETDAETAVDSADPTEESPAAVEDSPGDDPSADHSSPDDPDASASSDAVAEARETDPSDVDLEAAAVSVMAELDDGDGADREAVLAAVVDEYGVDPDAVEDAIQEALMSGQCYEPSEGTLKAI
jgi:RPA family protein